MSLDLTNESGVLDRKKIIKEIDDITDYSEIYGVVRNRITERLIDLVDQVSMHAYDEGWRSGVKL